MTTPSTLRPIRSWLPPLVALACVAAASPGCDFKSNGVSTCAGAGQTSTTSGAAIGIGSSNYGGNSLAQSFSVNAAASVTSVALEFQLVGPVIGSGSPTSVLTVTIEGNETGSQGNQPNGAPVATATLATAQVTNTNVGAVYNLTFPTAVSLTQSTTYWIRVRAPYASSNSNYISWSAFNGSGSPGGALYSTSGGSGAGTWDNAQIGSTLAFYYALGC